MTPGAPARKPRVLVVGPLPPQIGGVETFIQMLLESPALAEFDVVHVDTTKNRPKSTKGVFDTANFAWAGRHLANFTRVMAKHRPHVVYMPVAGTLAGVLRDLALCRIARLWPARVIGHQHASGIAEVLARRGWLGQVIRGGFRGYHRVLVLGRPWLDMFHDWDPTLVLGICPPAIRPELLASGETFARGVREGRVRALFVGQISRAKGVPEMIHAIKLLADEGRDVSLTLVGADGRPGRSDEARALAESLGVSERVEFAGPASGEALHEHYRRHDVFLLPSHLEGLPVALMEAGAFAMAVIATPVGSIPELIENDENGLISPVGRPDALAAAIARLADDPVFALRMGERLRAAVRAYHPERVSAIVAEAIWCEVRAVRREGSSAA